MLLGLEAPQAQNNSRTQSAAGTDIFSRIGYTASQRSDSVANQNITLQAVGAAEDSANVSPQAQSYAELQAIIARLQEGGDGEAIANSLEDLSDFVNKNSGATFSSGVLSSLGTMADTVLSALETDSDALSGGRVLFGFSGNFSQNTLQTDNFYSESTDFSFSFTYQTADTVLQGDVSFSESLNLTDSGYEYRSNENVSVGLVTFNPLQENPAVRAFNDIVASVGEGLGEVFGQVFEPAPLVDYESASVLDTLMARFEALSSAMEDQESLFDMLQEVLAPNEESELLEAA